jgi:HEPN domain-containing protein
MSGAPDLSEARAWLRFAERDLRSASMVSDAPDADPAAACFFAQQAAEKALKALLVATEASIPRTHDLRELRSRIPRQIAIEVSDEQLTETSDWAAKSRYPGDWREPLACDATAAITVAHRVVNAAAAWFEQETA